MTDTLFTALKALATVRTGFMIRNFDGAAMTDNETKYTATGSTGLQACRSVGGTICGMLTGRTPRCSA
jgi:hypothetical protein